MSDGKALSTPVPTSIGLTPTAVMDLSMLPERERAALIEQHAKGMLNLALKAQELHIDVSVLKNTLDQLSGTTKEVSESGNSVTVTHTQTTKIGRTEVVMGNTQEAMKGKVSRSASGDRDWTPYYVLGALIAVVLIAAMFSR